MDESTIGNESSELERICIGCSNSNGRPNNLAYSQGWKCLGYACVGLESNAEKWISLKIWIILWEIWICLCLTLGCGNLGEQ